MPGAPGNDETGPSGMRLRRALPEDYGHVVDLMKLIPSEADMTPAERDHVLAQLRGDANLEVWVVESETRDVVAFCALSFARTLTQTRAWLEALAVEPGFRRRGVGRALFELALRRARARGADQLLVDGSRGSPLAQDFYRAVGFGTEEVERIRIR
jgi:ribosomal protein S18 acetylase RimI-like enzyme